MKSTITKVVLETENTVVDSLVVTAGRFGAPTTGQKEHRYASGIGPLYLKTPDTSRCSKTMNILRGF